MKSNLFLGNNMDVLKSIEDNSIDSIVTDPPYGISFMGKKWDYDVPSVLFWKEILRVLKPGGHAIVACGTRTQHRMAINLEDAGFEIRDIVAWVYGSGFPKSRNIGKDIDEMQGNEREIVGNRIAHDIRGNALMEASCPEYKKEISKIRIDITKGKSDWEGWGTALKPAMELWTLCRKPISESTIAENVLKHGTGGINIDESRISTEENITNHSRSVESAVSKGKYGSSIKQETHQTSGQVLGRFPANFIHDGSDEVVNLFPETKSGAMKHEVDSYGGISNTSFLRGKSGPANQYGNEGSAARFFYCAKASTSERNEGLDEFPEKRPDERDTIGMGTFDEKGVRPQQNFHPTVKPVKLMKYLCKLITPKGGIILDPFMGSGSTGIAATLEGFDFIGIEKESDFFDIAKTRIGVYVEKEEIVEKRKERINMLMSMFKKKDKI